MRLGDFISDPVGVSAGVSFATAPAGIVSSNSFLFLGAVVLVFLIVGRRHLWK